MQGDDYSSRQSAMDREYREAWEQAPEAFKAKAEAAGLEAHVDDKEGHAMEFEANYASAGYTIDIAAALDSQVDELCEIHGDKSRKIIQDVVDRLIDLADKKVEQNNSLKLARVVMMLVSGGKKNVLAKVHGLMHAVPRLAIPCGFASMRASGRECGVSVEWVRKTRNQFCDMLEIPVPVESSKSEEAKAEYKRVATTPGRHWRNQVFVSSPSRTVATADTSESHQTQTHETTDTNSQPSVSTGLSDLAHHAP
jgi:hypothetical protein